MYLLKNPIQWGKKEIFILLFVVGSLVVKEVGLENLGSSPLLATMAKVTVGLLDLASRTW